MSLINNRLGLQTLLESLFASLNLGGTDEAIEDRGAFDPATDANVYFQPPESVKLRYPCIIYSRDSEKTDFANDKPYQHKIQYMVIVIDPNPDSVLLEEVAMLPTSTFIRHYTADNLNHDVYNIYY